MWPPVFCVPLLPSEAAGPCAQGSTLRPEAQTLREYKGELKGRCHVTQKRLRLNSALGLCIPNIRCPGQQGGTTSAWSSQLRTISLVCPAQAAPAMAMQATSVRGASTVRLRSPHLGHGRAISVIQ